MTVLRQLLLVKHSKDLVAGYTDTGMVVFANLLPDGSAEVYRITRRSTERVWREPDVSFVDVFCSYNSCLVYLLKNDRVVEVGVTAEDAETTTYTVSAVKVLEPGLFLTTDNKAVFFSDVGQFSIQLPQSVPPELVTSISYDILFHDPADPGCLIATATPSGKTACVLKNKDGIAPRGFEAGLALTTPVLVIWDDRNTYIYDSILHKVGGPAEGELIYAGVGTPKMFNKLLGPVSVVRVGRKFAEVLANSGSGWSSFVQRIRPDVDIVRARLKVNILSVTYSIGVSQILYLDSQQSGTQ